MQMKSTPRTPATRATLGYPGSTGSITPSKRLKPTPGKCPPYTERFPIHAAVTRNDLRALESLLPFACRDVPSDPPRQRDSQTGEWIPQWSSWTSWGIAASQDFDLPLALHGIDEQGQTPLHLAVVLHHYEALQLLLAHGADPAANNLQGWTPIDDAIYYYDDAMVYLLYARSCEQAWAQWTRKLPALLDKLESIPDFYFELKWSFHSYVPFLARFAPSDNYRIWKKGSNIRFEYSLIEWRRGSSKRADMCLYLMGRDSETPGEIIIFDRSTSKVMYSLDHLRHPSHEYICEEATNLYYAQTGSGFVDLEGLQCHTKVDRQGNVLKTIVAGHETEEYHMAGRAVFRSKLRSRRKKSETPTLRPFVPPYPTYSWDEGLYDPTESSDDEAEGAAKVPSALDNGATRVNDCDDDTCSSNSSQDGVDVQWYDTIEYSVSMGPRTPDACNGGEQGIPPFPGTRASPTLRSDCSNPLHDLYSDAAASQYKEKVERKSVKTHMHIAVGFPIKLTDFFPILEAITPARHMFTEAKSFLDLGLPGFPLSGSLPVYHALNARFEFPVFELRPDPSMFDSQDFALPDLQQFEAVERIHTSNKNRHRPRTFEASFHAATVDGPNQRLAPRAELQSSPVLHHPP